jgi:hypothetical protein
VSQIPSPKPQAADGPMPAHVRKSGASKKRRRLAKMSLGVFAVGASIAAVAVFAVGLSTNGASRAEPNGVGTIVLHSSASGCQQRSFNNQTGQISDQTSPCANDVVLDARGMPMPTGTVHTLNSISKSFK